MGRRRRRWRESAYAWWAVFAVLGLITVALRSWRLALITLLLWSLYEFCLVPTNCRVMTRQGYTCLERVRGRLFACNAEHQQIKNDALWRLAGLSNPFRKPPPPPDPNRVTGVLVVSPKIRGTLEQGDRIVLTVAALATVLTVAGMVAGLAG
jgi:hypothetical protein